MAIRNVIMAAAGNAGAKWWQLKFQDGYSYAQGLAIDSSGNAIVSGYAATSTNFIAKVNSSGVQQWQRKYAASVPYSLATDTSDNVIAFSPNGLTAKYNSSGALQWQRVVTNHANVYEQASACDSSGNMYSAYFYGIVAVVEKRNTSGVLQWSKEITLSGTDYTATRALTVAPSGDIYVGVASASASTMYVALVKLSSAGAITWQRSWSTPIDNILASTGVATDSSGNVYFLIGRETNPGAVSSLVLYKFNSSGTAQWQRALTHVNGETVARAGALAVSASGDCYVGTYTSSPNKACLVKYNTSGTIQYGQYFGSSYATQIARIVVAPTDFIYLAMYDNTSPRAAILTRLRQDGSATTGTAFMPLYSGSVTESAGALSDTAGSYSIATFSQTDAAGAATDAAGTVTPSLSNVF
jgi:hypothetical protein